MQIKDAVVMVTGANRGLGRVFVEQALARGAKKVYAGARTPGSVDIDRAIPVALDVTRTDTIAAAVANLGDVTLLVNNAGISLPGGIASADNTEGLERQLDTNFFGLLQMAQAFAPVLQRNGGGAMVNMLSALAWINAPALSGYCVSKAAAWMATNALRNELRAQKTLVVGVHAGFIDTDMASGFGGPKTAPEAVVAQAFDAVEQEAVEVLADEPARRARASLSLGGYLQPVAFK